MNKTSVIQMTVDQWIKVKDNPIQRNTERHAITARHLATPLSIHAIVYAAQLPDGSLVKLDGHTRALLWERGEVEQPAQLQVNVIQATNLEEVEKLYLTIDSKEALETPVDKISGGFRKIEFNPHSTLLQSGSITKALRIALQGVSNVPAKDANINIHNIIPMFVEELKALDELAPKKKDMTAGIVAAFILSYRKHKERVTPFWKSYLADTGVKLEDQRDGVQALKELTSITSKSSGLLAEDLCGRALNAVEHWLVGETFKMMPRFMPVTGYIKTFYESRPSSNGSSVDRKKTIYGSGVGDLIKVFIKSKPVNTIIRTSELGAFIATKGYNIHTASPELSRFRDQNPDILIPLIRGHYKIVAKLEG